MVEAARQLRPGIRAQGFFEPVHFTFDTHESFLAGLLQAPSSERADDKSFGRRELRELMALPFFLLVHIQGGQTIQHLLRILCPRIGLDGCPGHLETAEQSQENDAHGDHVKDIQGVVGKIQQLIDLKQILRLPQRTWVNPFSQKDGPAHAHTCDQDRGGEQESQTHGGKSPAPFLLSQGSCSHGINGNLFNQVFFHHFGRFSLGLVPWLGCHRGGSIFRGKVLIVRQVVEVGETVEGVFEIVEPLQDFTLGLGIHVVIPIETILIAHSPFLSPWERPLVGKSLGHQTPKSWSRPKDQPEPSQVHAIFPCVIGGFQGNQSPKYRSTPSRWVIRGPKTTTEKGMSPPINSLYLITYYQ